MALSPLLLFLSSTSGKQQFQKGKTMDSGDILKSAKKEKQRLEDVIRDLSSLDETNLPVKGGKDGIDSISHGIDVLQDSIGKAKKKGKKK